MTSPRKPLQVFAWATAFMTLALPASAGDATAAGTAAANAASSTWITVESPFTGDDDRDGYTTYELATSPSGPFTAGPVTHIPGPPEWRAVDFSSLTPGTSYYVRATWVDPDGVTGTNPQLVGPVTTPASAPASTSLLPATVQARDTGIYVSVPMADDANHNADWNVYVGPSATGPWTEKCGVADYRPKRCRIRSLTPGTDYWVRVDMIDPDGVVGTNPQVYGPIHYSGATNLALGRPVSADPGWGCCPNPAGLVDGRIQQDAWPYGFAWTGGNSGWAGGAPGWKQATIDFGVPTTFARAAMWYHDSSSPPVDWKFQHSNDGAAWTDLVSVTWPVCRGATQPTLVYWSFPSCAHDASFPPVTARYFRYTFDDRTLFGGLHGWASELEVFDEGAAAVCNDADSDGYGDPGDASCPGGPEIDCDDTDGNNYPNNTEVCDGQDNDCDTFVDEGFDNDGDTIADCFDADDDNDGVADGADADAFDPDVCGDADADTCDDCSVGTDDFGPLPDNDPANDGPDADADGICDLGDPTFNCPDPAAVDYGGFTAAGCASSVVKAKNQAALDAYLLDFGVGGGSKPKHLNVEFNPAGNVVIPSPCRIKMLGVAKRIDLAGAVCLYGRAGVTVGAGTPDPASAIDAGGAEILMVSEEGQVQTQPGIGFTADLMTLAAATTAEIGTGSSLDVAGPLALASFGTGGDAVLQPGSQVLAGELAMTAANAVRLRDDSDVAVAGDLLMISAGGTASSKAEIQQGSIVVVGGDLDVIGFAAKIGASADVGVTGAATLAALGSATASDAEILSNATLNAESVSQTAEHKAVLSGGATVDAGAGNVDIDAPVCVIHGTVLAGTTSGACLP